MNKLCKQCDVHYIVRSTYYWYYQPPIAFFVSLIYESKRTLFYRTSDFLAWCVGLHVNDIFALKQMIFFC
jgi:hypothetical protein